MERGEECVVEAGIIMMPKSCADNWGTVSTRVKVRHKFIHWERDSRYRYIDRLIRKEGFNVI